MSLLKRKMIADAERLNNFSKPIDIISGKASRFLTSKLQDPKTQVCVPPNYRAIALKLEARTPLSGHGGLVPSGMKKEST